MRWKKKKTKQKLVSIKRRVSSCARRRGRAGARPDERELRGDSFDTSNKFRALEIPVTAEPQVNGDATGGGGSSIASTPPSQSAGSVVSAPIAASHVAPWIDDEPVVKSPPEPTRVKSPEQMIMRSPEPVNWTVPLDTGKTFTVTQNVREGTFSMDPLATFGSPPLTTLPANQSWERYSKWPNMLIIQNPKYDIYLKYKTPFVLKIHWSYTGFRFTNFP